MSSSAKYATPTRAPVEASSIRKPEDLGIAADDRQLGGDAGVGDHDVEAAQVPDRGLDGAVDLLAVAHVADHGQGVTALGGHARERLGLEAGQGDARAAAVQAPGGGSADPAGGTRDQDAAPSEIAGVPT